MEVVAFLYVGYLFTKYVILVEPPVGPQLQQTQHEFYDERYSRSELNQIARTAFGVVQSINYVSVAQRFGATKLAQEVTVSLYPESGRSDVRVISVVQIHDILDVGDLVKVTSLHGKIRVSLR